ncbi:MAG: heavy metal translocating P-type ATPase [Patescibacteria group bacterium]
MHRLLHLIRMFLAPLFILIAIMLFISLPFLPSFTIDTTPLLLIAVAVGSYGLTKEIVESLARKNFALDYIAVLAITVSLFTGEYLVAAVIALMLSTGQHLEAYGIARAKHSLSQLVTRIPQTVFLTINGQPDKQVKISSIQAGQHIFIRKGEVIPLDGTLASTHGFTDESSVTGEPYMVEKLTGDTIRSGTVNTGEAMVLKVTKPEKDSTYRKIIAMVQKAQEEKSPFIRLADRYSAIFTIVTLAIASFAYSISRDINTVLAVLVIATPCPLIIATPIALLGGVNKAAKKRIIVKKLASIEVLSRINTLVFDKTGTITLGIPTLTHIEIIDKAYPSEKILTIAQSLERNSLHPLAKTILAEARRKKLTAPQATEVKESIGSGISGVIEGKKFTITKVPQIKDIGMAIGLLQDKKLIAILHFEDEIKTQSKKTLAAFRKDNLDLYIFTGDKQYATETIAAKLGQTVHIKAEMTPEQKQAGISELKKQGKIIGMVGDGINDAPALAKADVGIVFSNEEQTAASEAADIVLLGGNFAAVEETMQIAKRTISIAMQSILWGIGLSTAGMILAAFGYIPPIVGAGIQEAIDIAVIINALRASR